MPRIKKESSKNLTNLGNKPRKSKKTQTLKGFKDVLPDTHKVWNFIFEKVKSTAHDFGYLRIDTPIVENVNLFTRTLGEGTDVVEKEMFTFEDKGGEKVTLRPEFTAPVVRSYIQHGMLAWPQPVKLWYWGPVFRYDKPQAGRYRQFNQFGFEIFGNAKPEVDTQLIILASDLYKSFGIDISLRINSIGCSDCRKEYIKDLKDFLADKKLCKDCQLRLQKNPLRVLDCKENKCREIIESAPQIIDSLCEACKNHFVKVLEGLDESGLVYTLDPLLVRGLDYYSRTTFEIYPAEGDKCSQAALGGGGRYDYLVEQLGGRPTPAIGFAGGVERCTIKINEKGIKIKDEITGDVFVAQLGEEARKKASQLFNTLRKEGIKVRSAFTKKGLSEQMEEANRINVKYTLILGQKEILDDTVIVRDMDSGIQEIVPFDKSLPEIKKRLLENGGVKIYNTEENGK